MNQNQGNGRLQNKRFFKLKNIKNGVFSKRVIFTDSTPPYNNNSFLFDIYVRKDYVDTIITCKFSSSTQCRCCTNNKVVNLEFVEKWIFRITILLWLIINHFIIFFSILWEFPVSLCKFCFCILLFW